jgi:hypothetical protein
MLTAAGTEWWLLLWSPELCCRCRRCCCCHAHPMSHSVLPLTRWYRSHGWKCSMDPLCRLAARSIRAGRCCASQRPQVVRELGSILQDSDLRVLTASQQNEVRNGVRYAMGSLMCMCFASAAFQHVRQVCSRSWLMQGNPCYAMYC